MIYCGRFESTLRALQASNKTIDESTKIWVFRSTLPKDLKNIINTWSMANPGGKLSGLISQLKIQYHLDKTEEAEEQAVALYSGDKNIKSNQRTTDSRRQFNTRAIEDGVRQGGRAYRTATPTCIIRRRRWFQVAAESSNDFMKLEPNKSRHRCTCSSNPITC